MIQATHKCSGRALHILLNTPKANILNAAMIGAISKAVDTMVSDETCLIVFEGAGGHEALNKFQSVRRIISAYINVT